MDSSRHNIGDTPQSIVRLYPIVRGFCTRVGVTLTRIDPKEQHFELRNTKTIHDAKGFNSREIDMLGESVFTSLSIQTRLLLCTV